MENLAAHLLNVNWKTFKKKVTKKLKEVELGDAHKAQTNRCCKILWMRRRDSFMGMQLPCMFRTLATNFQDGSWIYRLMDLKSRGT